MRKIYLLPIALITFQQSVLGAAPEVVNLRPISAFTEGDGPRQSVTLFQHGKGYVGLRIPANWQVQGAAQQAVFTSPDLTQTTATWRPYMGKIPLDDPKKSIEAVRKLTLSAVPAGAELIVLAKEPESIALKGKPGLEAQVTFNLAGTSLRRAVILFEDKNSAQYSFIITATAADFDKAHLGALSILNSWWTVTERDLPELTIGN